ncbi:MAG: peptidase S1 and S6 chymotrypsin/Hap [bacterium]|nr:MAG: peptidase S1 and S6 chymotrypsin/Hap [bacterium]KAF0148943.1 MAG: peptidase S1 and S6 chymotrypsin/Hap [bacterium]KAF0168334.1 MAG: peptidase S1 and S6 chymotrypsin/Hap [bacterium]TXT22648.1 MAG: peptidase S1 and S6 chymotrypsin/Hap [bacterium]
MHKAWLIFAQCVAALVVVAAALLALNRFIPGLLPFDGAAVTIREVVGAHPGVAPPSSLAEAAARSRPSVVNIFTSKQVRVQRSPFMDDPVFRRFFGDQMPQQNRAQRVSNLGSGVIVSEDGFILTNHHVIEAADEIQVALPDGKTVAAEIVGTDPETDLAVLKVQRKGLPAILFAPPDGLRVGDLVLAIGNPFGVGQTVTMGIISALGRSHLGINTFESYIQTDAAINPGNSGGALVDSAGHLIGINTAIFSRSGGNLGIGFAIPVSIVRQVMEQIIQHGAVTRGWVGIEVQEITPEIAESFNLKSTEGALIAGVLRGGPADRAGIHPGDVLVGVGDKPVTDSSSLLNLIAALPPGKVAQLRLIREQAEMRVGVTVEKRPVLRKSARE